MLALDVPGKSSQVFTGLMQTCGALRWPNSVVFSLPTNMHSKREPRTVLACGTLSQLALVFSPLCSMVTDRNAGVEMPSNRLYRARMAVDVLESP